MTYLTLGVTQQQKQKFLALSDQIRATLQEINLPSEDSKIDTAWRYS